MRIGIILTGDYNWAGGLYYSLNIVKLLTQIADNKNLKVIVITNNLTPKDVLQVIPIKNTEIVNLDKKSFVYKAIRKVLGDRMVKDINALQLNILYPSLAYYSWHDKLNCQVFYWMFDFQHRHMPKMFSPEEFKQRETNFFAIAEKAKNIVFSSHNAKEDFFRFYFATNAKLHVYQFVSLLDIPEKQAIKSPYPSKYFIVCNQFWPHKNHEVVLKALAFLKKSGYVVNVVFTGKFDYELSKDYVTMLNNFIRLNKIKDQVFFTGFLSRHEQIQLIQNALAVIQPSLFEGWSTVIEDAKALDKFIVASDIAINREQINDNMVFFDPKNDLELSEHLLNLYSADNLLCDWHYYRNIEKSKEDLIHIFNIN